MDEYDSIDDQELSEIIGEASRRKEADEEELTVDEVKQVAEELGIAPAHVDGAIHELERRKQAARASRELERARRQKLRRVSGLVGAAVLVLVVATFGASYSSLQSALSEADQKRAQVENVLERQARTERLYAGQPASIEKNAALEGSENRVRIAIRRYDEVAAGYNSSAAGFPGGLVASAMDLPAELPLSDDIEPW